MTWFTLAAIMILLPLFPLSMLFNRVLARAGRLRVPLLLAWPQLGLLLLERADPPVPDWIAPWAVMTALLYALRAVATRDLDIWLGYVASSAWALLWLLAPQPATGATLPLLAAGFSAPLALLAVIAAAVRQRFGAAYAGAPGGLARTTPRLALLLLLALLASVATPVFPGFFGMFQMLATVAPAAPLIAVALLGVWFLWAWAAGRMVQGMVVGPGGAATADLGPGMTWLLGSVLAGLAVAGLYQGGQLL